MVKNPVTHYPKSNDYRDKKKKKQKKKKTWRIVHHHLHNINSQQKSRRIQTIKHKTYKVKGILLSHSLSLSPFLSLQRAIAYSDSIFRSPIPATLTAPFPIVSPIETSHWMNKNHFS